MAAAQDLFEIQVYPYETVKPRETMVEFHTNFIPSGTSDTSRRRVAARSSARMRSQISSTGASSFLV